MKKLVINEEIVRMRQMMGINENTIKEDNVGEETVSEDMSSLEDVIVHLMNTHNMDYDEASVFSKEFEDNLPVTHKDVEDFFTDLSNSDSPEVPGFEGTMDKLNDLSIFNEEETEDPVNEIGMFHDARMGSDDYLTPKETESPRQCSLTGEGMDAGWVHEDRDKYFKYEKDVVDYIKGLMTYNRESIKDLTDDEILEIGYNKYNVYYTEWEEDDVSENDEVKKKFKDEYGKKKGEAIYYATANKQDRDPETFEKNESFDPLDAYEEGESDCCGAPIFMGDICSDCYEHCSVAELDEESAIGGWDLAMEAMDTLESEIKEEEQSWLAMRSGKEGKVYENRTYEGRAYAQETYFETQSGALESAEEYALNRGYEADMASFYPEHIKYGQTVSYSVELSKNGKPVKNKMLQISLYRMDSGKYELTNYIN